MTPQEALQLLDNLASQVNLTRQQHDQVREAVRAISIAINSEEP